MGLLLSIFKKKKSSTKEVLVQIEEKIETLKSSLKSNHQLKNKCVWILLLTSIFLYFGIGIVIYLWFMPKEWSKRILYLLPFLGFPILIFFMRKLLHFFFVTRTTKISKLLDELKSQKKKILENVMETETYKVAKEILEKFDPERTLVEKDAIPVRNSKSTPGTDIRKRNIQTQQTNIMAANNSGHQITPLQGRIIHGPGMRTPNPNLFPRMQQPLLRAQSPMMTPQIPNAPILPRERSVFDKVAEYIVGDGPNNRYALICKQCFSHNGMALAEEFEYIAYKCCYCGFFNAPRKQRLTAPKESTPAVKTTVAVNRDSGHSSSEENPSPELTEKDSKLEKKNTTASDDVSDDVNDSNNTEESNTVGSVNNKNEVHPGDHTEDVDKKTKIINDSQSAE